MVAIRALQRRVNKLEYAGRKRPSPLVRWYGSFDNFVANAVWPGIRTGALSEADMFDIMNAMKGWEDDGTWDRAHAY